MIKTVRGVLTDLTGKKIGRLRVICLAPRASRAYRWLCQCSCGNRTTVFSNNLLREHTLSCGCLRYERLANSLLTHGHCKGKVTVEYKAYCHAKARCNNPNDHKYPIYGGRGIKFLFKSFPEFYAELGPRPAKHSLDRIDVDGHYEVGNVRWATAKVQSNNRRMCLDRP